MTILERPLGSPKYTARSHFGDVLGSQRSSPNAAPTAEGRDPFVRHHSKHTMALLWRGYCQALQRHPFKVKATTSGCTFATTDAIAQSRDDKPYDWTATARNASFGVLWLGPANHLFWGRTVGLERWFPGNSWANVFKRVLVDQATLMPLNMALFLAWPALWARDLRKAREDVEGSFVDSVSFALCVWPVVHPFSFRYVPLEHRLLVLNACSLVTFSFATFVKGSQPCEDDVCDASELKRRRTIAAAAAAAG